DNPGLLPFQKVELRSPDQGAVAENPDVVLRFPGCQESVERGLALVVGPGAKTGSAGGDKRFEAGWLVHGDGSRDLIGGATINLTIPWARSSMNSMNASDTETTDLERRFGGLERLYGAAGLERV